MKPLIFIIIVGYNHKKYLEECLDSVLEQTYRNFKILYIDNASEDESISWLKSYQNSVKEEIKIIANQNNLGYAGGYNQGINYSFKIGEEVNFFLCLTPDVVLKGDFLEQALKVFQKDERIGAVTGKLLKLSSREKKIKIIDSTGIILKRDRSAIDRGEGEEDHGQYDQQSAVFGVSGAAPLYRIEMIKDIAYKKTSGALEFIDNKFFAYKDDVDLGYRMQWAGWRVRYAPQAVAYHARVIGKGKGIIVYKREQGSFAKYLSFRNNLWLLFKDESPINLFLDSPFIILRQLKIWGYCLIFEFKLLKALKDAVLGLPYCLKMRRQQVKRINWKKFREIITALSKNAEEKLR